MGIDSLFGKIRKLVPRSPGKLGNDAQMAAEDKERILQIQKRALGLSADASREDLKRAREDYHRRLNTVVGDDIRPHGPSFDGVFYYDPWRGTIVPYDPFDDD